MSADRLLVGHDGSPRARDVLRAAVALARRLGARIWLFRAAGIPVELPRELYGLSPDELTTRLLAQTQAALDEAAREIPPDLLGGVRAAMGPPWQAICQAGKDVGAGCIIIGSHGYGAVDRLIGTTAAKVVNHADRSVLVIRHGDLLL